MTMKGKHINKMFEDDGDRRTKQKRNALYSVAPNNSIGQHLGTLKDAVKIRGTGVLIREILIEAIKQPDCPTDRWPDYYLLLLSFVAWQLHALLLT